MMKINFFPQPCTVRSLALAALLPLLIFTVLTIAVSGCGDKADTNATLDISGPEGLTTSCRGQVFKGGKVRLRMPPGKYLLKFSAPGFCNLWRTETLRAGTVAECRLQMVPVRAAVLISTRPTGARVKFGGAEIGTTPVVIRDLEPGTYAADLTRRGYAPRTVKWEVVSERPRHVMVDLEDNLGRISFASTPNGAKVLLDGREAGVTPCEIELEEGKYNLRLTYTGYTAPEEKITLNRGQKLRIDTKMQALPGSIAVVTDPAGAEVFIDGAKCGVTPCRLENITPGNYGLKLVCHEYDPLDEIVAITGGDNGEFKRKLVSIYGSAVFNVRPAGVELLVDGKPVGKVSAAPSGGYDTLPVHVGKLVPGEHKLTIAHPLVRPVGKIYRFSVTKGEEYKHPPITAWMANCRIVFADGREQIGMLSRRTDEYIEFGPEPGVRYQLECSKLRSVTMLNEGVSKL